MTEAKLLPDERHGSAHHLVDPHRLTADRRDPPERAQMRDDLRGVANLLHGVAQLVEKALPVRGAELQMIDRVPDEQPDVVERVVQLVRDPRSQLAQRGQLAGLDELLLLVAELLLATLDFLGRLPHVPHDVDHGLPPVLEPQVGAVSVLEDVHQRPPRVVQPLGLPGQPAAIVLVVDEDVQHGFALAAEALVERINVLQDVKQGSAALLTLPDARLEPPRLLEEAGLRGCDPADAHLHSRRGIVGGEGLGEGHGCPPAFILSSCSRSVSTSFSRAIILSSRPTTTSSNFSRSRIFSCSSVCDARRSRTTRS